MKFTRSISSIFIACVLVCTFNSCRKSPDELVGPVDTTITPAPPFITEPDADDGEGTHFVNGSTKPWEINGNLYTAIGGITIDTSNSVHRIWLNGQFFPKVDNANQPNKKDVNVFLQSVNFKFDSLALSDIDQVVTNEQRASSVTFSIRRSIFRQQNGADRVRDFDTLTISPNREGPVKGIVTARFFHLKNNDPIIPFKYNGTKKYQGVLEIRFSITVDVDIEREKLVVKDKHSIEGSVRVYFNYGNVL